MKYRSLLITWAFFIAAARLSAQHYTAIHGSDQFGSLNVYNNPASIVHSPYRWDLTLFGTQFTTISNGLRGHNFPFYLSPSSSFSVANGEYARRADVNYNLHLLNFRYSINRNQAVAVGINFKGYLQASTSRINYTDSVKGPLSFLSINEQNRVLQVRMTSSAWMELYGTYGFTLWDREAGKLAGGVTIKVQRSLSGAFANASDVNVARSSEGNRVVYKIANGNARYGYSANYGDGRSFQAADLFSRSRTTASVDVGVEYVVKTQAVTSVYDEDDGSEYEWKIGLALLDLGASRYDYGPESRQVATLKDNVTGTVLQDKFFSVKDLPSFNDSLASIVNVSNTLSGNFAIANPARAVINVDRYVAGNFYVNGELSFNLSGGGSKLAVQEYNLLTVTPRWENRRFGAYLPVQYTQRGNFWIGGAVKVGPLLLGTHNLLNIFSSNQYLSGGAYLALILRPSNLIRDPRNKQYDCPRF